MISLATFLIKRKIGQPFQAALHFLPGNPQPIKIDTSFWELVKSLLTDLNTYSHKVCLVLEGQEKWLPDRIQMKIHSLGLRQFAGALTRQVLCPLRQQTLKLLCLLFLEMPLSIQCRVWTLFAFHPWWQSRPEQQSYQKISIELHKDKIVNFCDQKKKKQNLIGE